jgi:alanyl-tRNA synthetase
MKTLTGQELRQLWDKFWQSKQHRYLLEVSLIADKESTAMFNVA